MKKIYMQPQMEVYKMETENLICLSGKTSPADPAKEVLIKNGIDFDDPLEDFDNPMDDFENPLGGLLGL